MDNRNIEYKIEVEQAYRVGKQIQYKFKKETLVWRDVPILNSNPMYLGIMTSFAWDYVDYRIKPEEKSVYQLGVEQAFKDGKEIEFESKEGIKGWYPLSKNLLHIIEGGDDFNFDWVNVNYRIKPEEKTEYQKKVEKAYSEGKKIEIRGKFEGTPLSWYELPPECSFAWDYFDYCIAEEYLYLWAYSYGNFWFTSSRFYKNEESAIEALTLDKTPKVKRLNYTKIKVSGE